MLYTMVSKSCSYLLLLVDLPYLEVWRLVPYLRYAIIPYLSKIMQFHLSYFTRKYITFNLKFYNVNYFAR